VARLGANLHGELVQLEEGIPDWLMDNLFPLQGLNLSFDPQNSTLLFHQNNFLWQKRSYEGLSTKEKIKSFS
jgi:hypothetical protein